MDPNVPNVVPFPGALLDCKLLRLSHTSVKSDFLRFHAQKKTIGGWLRPHTHLLGSLLHSSIRELEDRKEMGREGRGGVKGRAQMSETWKKKGLK